jgi:hypothetical protein
VTDEHTAELLSRYVDDDLDPHQRLEVERRLKSDLELARELQTLIELRRVIAELAETMNPPSRLEAMLEPIRRAVPPRVHRLHPAVRWLATAAAAVTATIIAVEVTRQLPSQPDRRSTRPSPRATEPAGHDRRIFQLKPLPTSTVPDDQVPLGAVDRLVASPLPDPELPRPEPLAIIGPLAEAPSGTARADRENAPSHTATLVLRLADESTTRPVLVREPLPAGTFKVALEVSDERVIAVQPEGADETVAARLSGALLGSTLRGLPDGQYSANLVVQAEHEE